MTYPLTTITTPDNIVNVLQLTDTHLPLDTKAQIAGHNCYKDFYDCLNQALGEDLRCDFIMLTGDLVNEVHSEIYDRIFTALDKTNIPYACIPGNHDVTDEVGTHLPFIERALIPHSADPRLLSRYCVKTNGWQILLVDSSIAGKVSGQIDQQTLTWLRETLAASTSLPTIIALHHHVTPIASKWLDKHISINADTFWSVIEQNPNVKAVVTGHVHQQLDHVYRGVNVYATPSTCFQFLPQNDVFSLDYHSMPGYRWLQLHDNGEINSWVQRL